MEESMDKGPDHQPGVILKRALKGSPYSPSWFDRFTVWVDRLPGPPWVFYGLLGVAVVILEAVVQWREAELPTFRIRSIDIWAHGILAYLLFFMHYLDKLAASALKVFRPLIISEGEDNDSGQDTYTLLLYRLTTLPAVPAGIATAVGGLAAVLTYVYASMAGFTPNFLAETAGTPVSDLAFMTSFTLSNAVAGLILYHTVHQLIIISQIYTRHARINLYQLRPLYALSRPGAITAVGLGVLLYIFFLTTPESVAPMEGTRPIEIALGSMFAIIAGLTFVLPLYGAHQRISKEKERRLEEAASRFEATTVQLHSELDRGELDNMGNLNRALASLESEQEFLRKIPTWPWEPGVARSLAFALLIPLITYLMQRILGQVLGL
jgi:hypothetical protein